MFESMWHVLVNVTIICGICRGMHTHFACQHHCYSDRSEMEVCKVEQKIALLHSRNARGCYADLHDAVPYYTEELQGWQGNSQVEEHQPPICFTVDVLCPFTQTCLWS
jgi:hypothetical protein